MFKIICANHKNYEKWPWNGKKPSFGCLGQSILKYNQWCLIWLHVSYIENENVWCKLKHKYGQEALEGNQHTL